MTRTTVFHAPGVLEHDPGLGHPESPHRIGAIVAALQRQQLSEMAFREPQIASAEAIAAVHARGYVDQIARYEGRSVQLDPETRLSPHSAQAARLSAGSALAAVDQVCREPGTRAFALGRPPGHHALRDRAMGFCVFNNIAIATVHARATYNLSRILVLDWDVHHGNGTQSIFWSDPEVLFVSLHQSPLYPGSGAINESGAGAGSGYTINVPLAAGATDGGYRAALYEILVPICATYKPQLVLVSAGFDAHRDDRLGGMEVTEEGFAHMCSIACAIADTYAMGRLALVLEGGYDLKALSQSVVACVRILCGETPPAVPAPPSAAVRATIRDVTAFHRRTWTNLEPGR